MEPGKEGIGELTLEVRTDLQAGRGEGSAAAPCLAEGPAVLHGPGCSVPPFVGLSVATVGWARKLLVAGKLDLIWNLLLPCILCPGPQVILGNEDPGGVVLKDLGPPMVARLVLFYPRADRVMSVCLRVELYGCLWKGECSDLRGFIPVLGRGSGDWGEGCLRSSLLLGSCPYE